MERRASVTIRRRHIPMTTEQESAFMQGLTEMIESIAQREVSRSINKHERELKGATGHRRVPSEWERTGQGDHPEAE
jgi:hypothetical protein